MSRWYRAYEGTVTDPKLAEAAMDAGCSRSVAIAAWHLILENAATINEQGRIDIPARRIAAALCEPLAVVETLMSAFAAIGIVADSHVTAWNRRQYVSDNSTARSRKHRAKTAETLPQEQDATLQQRCSNGPETETETDSSVANATGGPPLSASQITKAIFDSGISILERAGRSNREARSIIGRWRKGFTDPEVLAMLSRMPDDVSEPLEWGTKALAWQRSKATGENGQHTRNGGIARALDRRLGFGGAAGEAGRPAIGNGEPDSPRAIAATAPM
jgi:hypothetical protein